MGHQEIRSLIEDLDILLKSSCGGLLEINNMDFFSGSPNVIVSLAKVEFLHRTVREFLETESGKSLVSDTIISPEFHPDMSLAISHVTMLKRAVFNDERGIRVWNCYSNFDVCRSVVDVMEFAKRIEVTGKVEYIWVVDELQRTGIQKWRMNEDLGQGAFHERCCLDPGEI